jgi:transcriptional regulator with XRE-family HTH domain
MKTITGVMQMSTFSARLKTIRESQGLTQSELSKRAGLGDQQVYRYENEVTKPNVADVTAIARQLDVSMDYLVGLTDTPKRIVLSLEEIELLDAWRRADINFVLDKFADKIQKYRDTRMAITGV